MLHVVCTILHQIIQHYNSACVCVSVSPRYFIRLHTFLPTTEYYVYVYVFAKQTSNDI
jgi:hypothetical protein